MVLDKGFSTTTAKSSLLAPYCSGRHFKLNGIGPSSINPSQLNSLLGPSERITVPLSTTSNPSSANNYDTIYPIYDTGASVSVLSQTDFRRVSHLTHCSPIRGWSCSVSAANGQNLTLSGAYLISLHFNGKSYLFAFLVSPDLTTSLFGINLALHYKFSFDADNRCVYVPNPKLISQPSHPNGDAYAKATICKSRNVDALAGCMVRARLTDLTGNNLIGCREGVLDTGELYNLVKFQTDEQGRFDFHFNNSRHEELSLPRNTFLGHVYSLEDCRPVYSQPAAPVGAVSTEHADPTLRRRRLRPHTPEEKAKIISILHRQVSASVPYQFRQQYLDLLTAREHAFSADDCDLGYSGSLIQHEIHYNSNEPSYTPQFRLAPDHLTFLKNSVMGWLKAGIIQRSRSLHNSPIFCVLKKSLKLRPVLDYRRINSRSLEDKYSILTVDDCIEKIGHSNATIFSSLDFRNSYWQLALRESDRPLTAFTLPGIGQFSWVSCPQGLMGAPSTFSRLMQGLMDGAQNCITYLDDCLLYTSNHDTHLSSLAAAIDRISANNLRLNPDKCIFGAASCNYLGITLQANGLKPGDDKVRTVSECPPPNTLRQLKSAAGLFNFFRQFIFSYAVKAEPLHRLTKASSGYKSGPLPPAALSAFYQLRKEITSRPLLAYPRKSGMYHLYVDACLGDSTNTGGYGAALFQEQPDSSRRPVAFASRLIAGAEANYPTTLAEWNSAVFGMNKFSHYLRGRRFCLYSDHKPLARPFEKLSRVHIKTLHRLNAKAEDFHPEIRFIEGKFNSVADFLSRFFGYNVSPGIQPEKLRINANVAYISHRNASLDSIDVTPDRLQLLQANDPDLKGLIEAASLAPPFTLSKVKGFRYPVTLRDGLLCVQTPPRPHFLDNPQALRIVCPASMHTEVLAAAHHSLTGGHTGKFKVTERIRDTFWWNNMDKDIATHVAACTTCRTASNKFPDQTPPLKPIPTPSSIGEVYFSDLFGPLTDSTGNSNSYVLTITDSFSKFVRCYKLHSKEATSVADALHKDFSVWSPPKLLVTDGGLEYRNELQARLLSLFGTRHRFTSIYHPAANAQSEIFNRTMRHFLATAVLDADRNGTAYDLYLPSLVHSYNSSVSHATHVAPFTTHFGIKMRVPLWPLLKDDLVLEPELQKQGTFPEYVSRLRKSQFLARQLAHDMADRSKVKNMASFNKSNRVAYTFHSVGDKVLCRRNDRRMTNQKLAPLFEPGIILRQVDDSTYLVRRYLRKRARDVFIHGSHIKRFVSDKSTQRILNNERNPDHQMSSSHSSSARLTDRPFPAQPNPSSSSFRSRSTRSARADSPALIVDRPPSLPPHRERVSSSSSSSLSSLQMDSKFQTVTSSEGELSSPPLPLPAAVQPSASYDPNNIPVVKQATRTPSFRSRSSRDPLEISLPPPPAAPPVAPPDKVLQRRKHGLSVHSSDEPPPRTKLKHSPSPDRSDFSAPPHVSDSSGSEGGHAWPRPPKHKFSHTSSDPLLAKLPRYRPLPLSSKDEILNPPSLDSDGFPHALSSSDSVMSSLSSSERRRRRRRKRVRITQPTTSEEPPNKCIAFHSFIAAIQNLPKKRRNKLFKDYSAYSKQQLYEAFLNGHVTIDFPSNPPPPLNIQNAARQSVSLQSSRGDSAQASPPPSPPPAHRPPAVAARPRNDGTPSTIFSADRSALRALKHSVLRAPRLLLSRGRDNAPVGAPLFRWRKSKQSRFPDPTLNFTRPPPVYYPPPPL